MLEVNRQHYSGCAGADERAELAVCVCVRVCFGEGQMRGQDGPLWADHLTLQSTGLYLLAGSCQCEVDGDRKDGSGLK